MTRIAAVTGAARGLGWGTAKALARNGFHVALLGRDQHRLAERRSELEAAGGRATVIPLDLADPSSVDRAAEAVNRAFPGGLHVLVNNAGIFPEKSGDYDPRLVRDTMQVNALGPLQFSLALAHVLQMARANVVNVSSGMGGLTEMNGGYPAYRLSKVALNGVTRYLSQEWPGVRVNSVCPGWVKTDMGGTGATRTVEEGVASILWAALLPEGGPTGGFYRDGKALAW